MSRSGIPVRFRATSARYSKKSSAADWKGSLENSGNLFTIPDRQCAVDHQAEIKVTSSEQGAANVETLLARSISFHFMENENVPYRQDVLARHVRDLADCPIRCGKRQHTLVHAIFEERAPKL